MGSALKNPFPSPYSRSVVGAKARSCSPCGGKLYRRSGKPEQAREHLRMATTMHRDAGMRFWREQGDAEMRELP